MQVRLNEKGQKALGFSPDRRVANVSDDRAFALMSRGFAAQDKGFMAMFNGPLPKKEKAEVKPVAPKPEKKFEKPKRETAVSKNAAKRTKAVKY